METANFMNSFSGSYELCIALKLCMACDLNSKFVFQFKTVTKKNSLKYNIYLKMIFLLTYKCVVDVGKIKAFICIHSIMRYWPKIYFKYINDIFLSFLATIIDYSPNNLILTQKYLS